MRIISKTLILLLIIALLPVFSFADNYQPLTTYSEYAENEYKKTLNAARGVDKQHSLMTELGAKYDSSQSAIAAGNTRTVAAVFGVTLTAFATGGRVLRGQVLCPL